MENMYILGDNASKLQISTVASIKPTATTTICHNQITKKDTYSGSIMQNRLWQNSAH